MITIGNEEIDFKIAAVKQKYTYPGNENSIERFKGNTENKDFDKWFKFYSENFEIWEEMESYYKIQYLDRIQNKFAKLEEISIKCRICCKNISKQQIYTG